MKLKNIFVVISVLIISAANLFAGTANIKGLYTGTYTLGINGVTGINYAKSLASYTWILDFNKGMVKIDNGEISTLLMGNVLYKITGPKHLIDNKDGTYTYTCDYQAISSITNTPKITIKSILNITKIDDGLLIKTVDSDNNGVLGSVISHPQLDFSLIFPKKIELNWSGNAN